MDCKFGSKAVDEGDSEGRLQTISSKIKDTIVGGTADDQPHRRKRNRERIFVGKDQQQDQPHRSQRIQENFDKRKTVWAVKEKLPEVVKEISLRL